MKTLRTTSLGSNLTGPYKKECIYLKIDSNYLRFETKYSRMDQVKFVEDLSFTNFTWSILEYFASFYQSVKQKPKSSSHLHVYWINLVANLRAFTLGNEFFTSDILKTKKTCWIGSKSTIKLLEKITQFIQS